MIKIITLLSIIIFFQGCTPKEGLYFATGTGLNVEARSSADTIPTLALGYKRYEFVRMPKTDGKKYSIIGTVDNNISFWNGSKISQKFATGQAAVRAAEAHMSPIKKEENERKLASKAKKLSTSNKTKKSEVLFLSTSTVFGMDIELGADNVEQKVMLGFKRNEITHFPVNEEQDELNSVYTDILIDNRADNLSDGNTIIKQSFATGIAAEILANKHADSLFIENNTSK
ncbi:MAG: hypothetical protein COB07_05910 [Sulfurovum sp.]|nr:MAG: hypothetical protein COB07_05910 [Sulfurovum sp.]